MAISLYDVSVRSFLQTVGAAEGFLAKGLEHFTSAGIDPNTVVETSLYPNMLPFKFQVASIAHHAFGAIEGAKAGAYSPSGPPEGVDYAGLQALVREARAGLEAVSPDEVNALAGKDVLFQFGDFKIPFVAEGFLMSFSLPNLHFHATTAYDILRVQGVPLGKRDYMGALRTKG